MPVKIRLHAQREARACREYRERGRTACMPSWSPPLQRAVRLRNNYVRARELRWPTHVTHREKGARHAGRAGWARRGGNLICPRRACLASQVLADSFSILLNTDNLIRLFLDPNFGLRSMQI